MSTPEQIADGFKRVADALEDGREIVQGALDVLAPAIQVASPYRTGQLRNSLHGELRGERQGAITSDVLYASIVDKRQQFVDRGVAASESELQTRLQTVCDGLLEQVGS
jgi:hypothetical protein